jgi:hypothetical protein
MSTTNPQSPEVADDSPKRVVLAVIALAALMLTLSPIPEASAATNGRTTNAAVSKSGITVSDYCYAAKLRESTAKALAPNRYTTVYNAGFRVPSGRRFSATKNGSAWISNATSQGNAVCYDRGSNVTITVLS